MESQTTAILTVLYRVDSETEGTCERGVGFRPLNARYAQWRCYGNAPCALQQAFVYKSRQTGINARGPRSKSCYINNVA